MPSKQQTTEYSVVKAIANPIWRISDNLWAFVFIGLFFATLLMLLSYLFGQTYMCLFNPDIAQSVVCADNNYLYLPYIIVKLFVLGAFITIWYDKVYKKEEINTKYILGYWRKWLLISLILIAFLIINLMPAVSGMLLLLRTPNPIWQVEVLYFTVVSVGFILPFVLMRFYSVIAEVLAGEPWKNFKTIWLNTQGNGLKIVFSTSVMFMISIVLLLSVNNTFQAQSALPAEAYNIIAEIVFNIITLFIVTLMVNFMQIQKEMIVGK